MLWFDEHNHPVKLEGLTPEQRLHVHRERCYKWVSLLHLRGGAYVYAAVALLPGKAHEVEPFYRLVEAFVQTVGVGVIQWLMLDMGFIDGARISRCKQAWDINVIIPVRRDLDIWTDAWALAERQPWTALPASPHAPAPVPPTRPEHLRRREAKRQKTLALRKQQLPPPPPHEGYQYTDYCWLGGFRSWSATTVPISVLCLRDHYADGHHQDWALMSPYPEAEPLRLLEVLHQAHGHRGTTSDSSSAFTT